MPDLPSPPWLNSAELTNGLVAQYVLIADKINKAEGGDDLNDCVQLIVFAATVWASVGYGYKTKELVVRIKERARILLNNEQAYLSQCRKNDRSRASTLNEISKLSKLVSFHPQTN